MSPSRHARARARTGIRYTDAGRQTHHAPALTVTDHARQSTRSRFRVYDTAPPTNMEQHTSNRRTAYNILPMGRSAWCFRKRHVGAVTGSRLNSVLTPGPHPTPRSFSARAETPTRPRRRPRPVPRRSASCHSSQRFSSRRDDMLFGLRRQWGHELTKASCCNHLHRHW